MSFEEDARTFLREARYKFIIPLIFFNLTTPVFNPTTPIFNPTRMDVRRMDDEQNVITKARLVTMSGELKSQEKVMAL